MRSIPSWSVLEVAQNNLEQWIRKGFGRCCGKEWWGSVRGRGWRAAVVRLIRGEGLGVEEAFKGNLVDVEELTLGSTRAKHLVKGLLCSYALTTFCFVWSGLSYVYSGKSIRNALLLSHIPDLGCSIYLFLWLLVLSLYVIYLTCNYLCRYLLNAFPFPRYILWWWERMHSTTLSPA